MANTPPSGEEKIRVLIVDYRGYGKSEGRPTEGGLYQDAKAAWGYLTSERHIPPDRIVLLGKSLADISYANLV
jgi:fermentation-respiration switch protein FrsA (DUF1100 family)